jgi:hypothetical protein
MFISADNGTGSVYDDMTEKKAAQRFRQIELDAGAECTCCNVPRDEADMCDIV